MPLPPPGYSDTDVDAKLEAKFPVTPKNDFIFWETRPPKDAKLFDVGTTPTGDAEQMTVFTVDSTKANGYAVSEPANASAEAQRQTARLKLKYE